MHLKSPDKALKEMMRIAKPGGLVICVEPNNFWNNVSFNSITDLNEIDTLVDQYKFWLICNKGRILLGKGNHTIGDFLPGLLAGVGLINVKTVMSDKASPIVPPYSYPEEKA